MAAKKLRSMVNLVSSEVKFDFGGKRVLVTGASKGIGRQTARTLAVSNAHVIAVARSMKDLESLRDEFPGDITPLKADLSDPQGAKEILKAAGDVDLCVNNAGITILDPFLDAKIEDMNKVMSVNVDSVMAVSQYCAKSMIDRSVGGAIVNVSSQASTVGLPAHAAYCASKGALDQITRVMAVELGPKQIRTNSVNPTVVLTAMGKEAWSDKAKADKMLERIPLGKFAEEQHVVDAILFLLSDGAAMINGAILPVDGGFWTT